MQEAQKIVLLTDNLHRSKKVNSFDIDTEREADRLANALIDFEKCFKAISECIPKLISKDISEENIDDLLLDIGEELRHVLYHMKDAKYYSYLTYYKQE